jgi:hypothetical protein
VTLFFSAIVLRLQIRQNRLEDRLRVQQTEATDKHIGWLAFKLSGQLRGWLQEKTAGLTVDELAAATRRGQPRLWGAWMTWVESQSSPQRLAAVEKGVEVIMEAAAGASPGTARIADDACRLFYQARGDLRNGLRHVREQDAIEQVAIIGGERPLSPEGRELFLDGYNALRACIDTLEPLIASGLRGRAAFLSASAFASVSVSAELSVGPPTASEGPAESSDEEVDGPSGSHA